MLNVIFICNQGINRSRTAAEIFKAKYNTKYSGLFSENSITSEDLLWADIIFVMEDFQRKEISERFPVEYLRKKILCLDIPDIYQYMDEKLIKELKRKIKLLNK